MDNGNQNKSGRRPGLSSPPQARLVLRAGTTGHRPNNLKFARMDLLQGRIQTVLRFLDDAVNKLHKEADSLYQDDLPLFRIVSPIAEGSDRLVAEIGDSSGWELQCPLPFHVEEYEKDFETDESRAEYHKFLGKATAILELDGSRETPDRQNQAYEAVGRMVLNQSDLVITIWDGEKSGKRGGTSQIVEEAERLSMPLIWIHSREPHAIHVYAKQGEWIPWESAAGLLYERLQALLLPTHEPRDERKQRKPDPCKLYFRETKIRWTLGFFWRMFRNLIADLRISKPLIKLADFAEATELEWNRVSEISPPLPKRAVDQVNGQLRRHYSWADQLADYYANVYRSAFVFNYLMSGFAVLFAFLSYASPPESLRKILFNSLEFLIISSILLVTYFGVRRRWHERWIDYRLLAEQLRQLRFLIMLGRNSVLPSQLPAHDSYGDPRDSWMSWHVRAIVREGGMLAGRFETNYLKAVGTFLNLEGVKRQIDYHENNSKQLERLNHRLHIAGATLFVLAFIAVSVHFIVHEERFALILTLITIVGPAFGAALAAIRSQGELDRVSKRSKTMRDHLQRVSASIDTLITNQELSSLTLADVAVTSAQLMIDEVLDWRMVFQERPLELPA